MHDIRIESEDHSYVHVVIDGIGVALSRCHTSISSFNVEIISKLLDDLKERLNTGRSLVDLAPAINGKNMLKLLDAFYFDEIMAYWKRQCEMIQATDYSFNKMFVRCFGFRYSTYSGDSVPLFESLRNYYYISFEKTNDSINGTKQQKLIKNKILPDHEVRAFNRKYDRIVSAINKDCSFNTDYVIIAVSRSNNVVTYSINGQHWEICLAGRPEMGYAAEILEQIRKLQTALCENDLDTLKQVCSRLGGKATCNLIGVLFPTKGIEFFCNYHKEIVYSKREQPALVRLLQSIFGCYATPYYLTLLSAMETQLPELNDYLVSSSIDEMKEDLPSWKLYYYDCCHLMSVCIIFDVELLSEMLIQEFQAFLRHTVATRIAAGTEFVIHVRNVWGDINRCLKVLAIHKSKLGFTSVLDLTSYDVLFLQSYFSQKADLQYSTWRSSMIRLKALYSYTLLNSMHDEKAHISPFKNVSFPPAELNPTKPVAMISLNTIQDRIDRAPAYIKLAFYLFIITGARASSIFLLTTDCLQKQNDGTYVLSVFSFKTEISHTLSNRPNVVKHKIPDKIATALLEYINNTDTLRKQLEKPHIFVYQSPKFRNETKRKPTVLTREAFCDEIAKLIVGEQLYDESGEPLRLTPMQIRAEVGRKLFSEGATASEVAAKLGNTPQIAKQHYNSQYPSDEARMYNELYSKTIEPNLVAETEQNAVALFSLGKQSMYGECYSSVPCKNENDCRTCHQRLVCADAVQI